MQKNNIKGIELKYSDLDHRLYLNCNDLDDRKASIKLLMQGICSIYDVKGICVEVYKLINQCYYCAKWGKRIDYDNIIKNLISIKSDLNRNTRLGEYSVNGYIEIILSYINDAVKLSIDNKYYIDLYEMSKNDFVHKN